MLSAGAKFGKYTIVRLLGSGGMGSVYLVRHEVLDAYFALKVLSADVASRNAQFIPRFLREAKLCCKIRHQNLVTVHDAGRDEATGLYYLVMDYAPGGSLREMLDTVEGPLDDRRSIRVVREIASALVTASEFGLVHRDIKPENIMFGQNGEAKLADLGIAKASDDSSLVTMENAVFGTPAYMSPEQAYDSSKVDARADIYSLGIVFFEMLAGKRPYSGSSSMNIIAKVLSKEPVPDVRTVRPDVPEKYAAVVRDMCEKNASKRISSARELLKRLHEIDGGGAPVDVVAGNVKHGVDPMVVLSVASGIIAVVLLCAAAWWGLRGTAKTDVPPVGPASISSPSVPRSSTNESSVGIDTGNTDVTPVDTVPPPSTNEPPIEIGTGGTVVTSVDTVPPPSPDEPPIEIGTGGTVVTSVDAVPPPSPDEPPIEIGTGGTVVTPVQTGGQKTDYVPLKPATIITPTNVPRTKVKVPEPPPDDPIKPGRPVVIGGSKDDAAEMKKRLGADAFRQFEENSKRIKEQIDEICGKNPSRIYLKIGSDALNAGKSITDLEKMVGDVLIMLKDNGMQDRSVFIADERLSPDDNKKIQECVLKESFTWGDEEDKAK